MILSRGTTVYNISTGGGLPLGIPLYWEIPVLHGVVTITSGTYTRISSKSVDLSGFPATYNGLNRDIRLNVIGEVPVGTGYTKLTDITTPGTADINFTVFNSYASSPTLVTSPSSIPVSATPGDLSPSNTEIYELQSKIVGGASFTISSAWLSIAYL